MVNVSFGSTKEDKLTFYTKGIEVEAVFSEIENGVMAHMDILLDKQSLIRVIPKNYLYIRVN